MPYHWFQSVQFMLHDAILHLDWTEEVTCRYVVHEPWHAPAFSSGKKVATIQCIEV